MASQKFGFFFPTSSSHLLEDEIYALGMPDPTLSHTGLEEVLGSGGKQKK